MTCAFSVRAMLLICLEMRRSIVLSKEYMMTSKAHTAWTHARGLYIGAALKEWQTALNNAICPVRTGAE